MIIHITEPMTRGVFLPLLTRINHTRKAKPTHIADIADIKLNTINSVLLSKHHIAYSSFDIERKFS